MLVRGRRLDPRRILRYLFQELIAPWIQLKRLWLRLVWFFTTPIYIGPMWTTSVVAGLLGVMMTILLFKTPGRLEASTAPVAVTPPPPAFLFTEAPSATTPIIDLDGRFQRTTLAHEWDQIRQSTFVSTSLGIAQQNILQPIRDGWSTAQRQLTETWPTVYRQTAPLWNAAAVYAAQPADQPARYGGAGESHPALTVTRDLPTEASPSGPITYSLTVQNRGAEILEQIQVTEQLNNLDRVEETFPPAEVSANALHWRIDSLRPGQERRLSVTLQPGGDREIEALADVRTTVSVSSTTRVTAVTPLSVNEMPPVLLETPRLAPVEPASREVAPRVPKLSVIAEIPTSLKVDDELSTVFVVSNTGNGDADDVVLTVEVPAGLEHRDGALVEHRYALIPAGTTKRALFKALARTPSQAKINAVLTMGGVRVADWRTEVQINAKPATPGTVAGSTSLPLSNGPVPEDGPALRGRSFGASPTQQLNGASPGEAVIKAPQGTSNPTAVPQTGLPVDSSIPRNRRLPAEASQPAAPVVSPPASIIPVPADSTIPKPAGQPAAQPEVPEDANFVNVPRRQGAGGVSGWKRVMHR